MFFTVDFFQIMSFILKRSGKMEDAFLNHCFNDMIVISKNNTLVFLSLLFQVKNCEHQVK